jgi:hypothetical protein
MKLLPRGIVIELEQGDGEELHVFGNSQDFYGTAKDKNTHVSILAGTRRRKKDGLRSGICTRKSFLHSLGFVMCAGTNGYYAQEHVCEGHVRCRTDGNEDTRATRTINVSKLGRHHWARQSPISQSLSIPWEALN